MWVGGGIPEPWVVSENADRAGFFSAIKCPEASGAAILELTCPHSDVERRLVGVWGLTESISGSP